MGPSRFHSLDSLRVGEADDFGLPPGVKPPAAAERVGLEVCRPDGTRRESHLATYGAPVEKGTDGLFNVRGRPDSPEFTLVPELSPEEVPVGMKFGFWTRARVNRRLKPTGAIVRVFRASTSLQAHPAAKP